MMSREMKDSGIEWIGEIPKNWEATRLKNLFRIKKNIAGQEGYNVLSVTQRGIKIKDLTKNEGQLAKDYSNYQLVDKNDFVMNHMDLLTGYVDCSIFEGVTSPDYRVFCCINEEMTDRKYYLYIFQACYSNRIFYGLGQGVSGLGRWRLPADQFLLFGLPIPSLSEQQKIANHLDTKCAEIDNLISLQEEMIAELKAYKQSVITEVVCKGLDKNVPMKDSGVEWIGEIPEGWEIKDFKRIFTLGKGLPITKADLVEQGISVISYGQIHSKTNTSSKVNDSLIRFVPNTYIETNRESLVVNGDFIFADTSEDLEGCGNYVYIDVNKQIFAGYHTITAHPIIPMHGQYLAFLFMTDCWRSQIRNMVTGVKLYSISRKILSKNTIIFPPLSEQQSIANYLDKKCANIDELISIKQQKAVELKGYKKSMIYEYVTGKKEVI